MKQMLSSVSPKGQITVPAEIRRLLGVKPKSKVAFRVVEGRVEIAVVQSPLDSLYLSVPALGRPLSDREMTRTAAEEHAQHVAGEGRG